MENQKKPPPLHIPSCRWLPLWGGMWWWKSDWKI